MDSMLIMAKEIVIQIKMKRNKKYIPKRIKNGNFYKRDGDLKVAS